MARRLTLLALTVALLGGAIALWRFTALADFITPDRLIEWMSGFKEQPWSAAAVIGVFVLAGLVAFPLTLLIAATAIVFHPAVAISVSFAGSLGNAALLYAMGARLLRGVLHDTFGSFVDRVNRLLDRRGIIA